MNHCHRMTKANQNRTKCSKTFGPSQDLGARILNPISASRENRRVVPYPRLFPSKAELLSSIRREDDVEDVYAGRPFIGRNPKEAVPEYWKHLEHDPMACARISERCFVLQDWNDHHKSLVVLVNCVLFSDPQYWKWNHVFRVTNSKGETKSYCNCSNGKRQTALCVHRELVEAHADGFRGPWPESEPKCALVGFGGRGDMCFSVASDLKSPGDSRHIRAIVMKEGKWKCLART
jgi:hypothetical protein